MQGQFVIYKDKSGKFRWKLSNMIGQVIARSGGCYLTKVHAVKSVGNALTTINSK